MQNGWILDPKSLINTYYNIGHRLELKYSLFRLFQQFLLNAHLAAHNLKKLKTENLKFRPIMHDCSVNQKMIVLGCRLLKNSQASNKKSKCIQSMQASTLLSMANIALHLAASFGCNQVRIIPEIISKLWSAAIRSRCAVHSESEQTPVSRTGCLFRFAALQCLHSIEIGRWGFVLLYSSYALFLLLTNEWLNKWAVSAAWVGNKFLQIPLKKQYIFFISHKNKNLLSVTCHCKKFTDHLHLLMTLELRVQSQYHKIGSTFFSWSKPAEASSNCSLGNSLCLCAPVCPA